MQYAHTRFATNIIIYSDNRTATRIVNGNPSVTCRKETKEIRDAQENWTRREKLAHISNGYIFAQWIPSHMGVSANEEADSLAKAGAQTAHAVPIKANPSHALVQKYINPEGNSFGTHSGILIAQLDIKI